MPEHGWTPAQTSDVIGLDSNLRNYLEQRDVRRCVSVAAADRPIRRAIDVGCGYGRLTMVLAEFSRVVTGFEREGALVAEARRLLPALRFVEVAFLENLPAETGSSDFTMTFTVLQHLRESGAKAVVAELKRVTGQGFVLLVEETDASLRDGDLGNEKGGVTIGRSVEAYQDWMKPYELALAFARQIEPGYPRSDVGTYMLFRAPQ